MTICIRLVYGSNFGVGLEITEIFRYGIDFGPKPKKWFWLLTSFSMVLLKIDLNLNNRIFSIGAIQGL